MDEWYTITCPREDCRIHYAVPASMVARAKRDGQSILCPNGHTVYWPGESVEDKLKKRVEDHEQMEERAYEQLNAERDESRELLRMLRECPACGWRSRKLRPDRVRADFAQHLSERHSLAIVGDLAEQLEAG